MSQPQNSFAFKDLAGEEHLAKRLGQQRFCLVFAGLTTWEERRERIREAILECGLDCTIIGRAPNGKPETYAQSFKRFYGEPLCPPVRKRTAAREPQNSGSGAR